MRKVIILLFFIYFIIPNYSYASDHNSEEISIDPSIGFLLNDFSYKRIKLSTKNIFKERIGVYYLFELNNVNNTDLIGLNFRVIENLYVNFGYQFFTNSNIYKGNRKEIGVSYNINNIPILINYGYSINMGSSINIAYRIYIKAKQYSW